MDDLTSDVVRIEDNNTSAVLPKFIFDRMNACLNSIEMEIRRSALQRQIAFEWQQVTRIIDRCLMIVYIFGTILFAAIILNSDGDELQLSDQLMDEIRK
jgi:hypothetical protein